VPAPRLDVCVVTYRRPEGLARLLAGLAAQRFPGDPPERRVVVVDNDAAGSARDLCDAAREWLDHPLVYALEKRRGIPQARNAAAALALPHADFLAFVDDDEVPEPGWLAELLRVQRACHADAVAGRVRPRLPAGTPAWIERGGFFETPRHATGERLDRAFTHNVLVRCRTLAQLPSLFDERLAFSGGSDDELFRRLAASGGRIVWADDAVVEEFVPASRARLVWVLARSFRVGCSTAWIERHGVPRRSAARLLGSACKGVVRGMADLALSAFRGRVEAARALRTLAECAGRLASLAGFRYDEYRTTHGS
jgi:glycosyltransferase involved in cell wall biosynthesis